MKTILNDIRYEITHLNTGLKALRNFTLALGVLALALSGLAFYRGNSVWPVWAIAGSVICLVAFLRTRLTKPVYLIAASVAAVIGYFLSRIILIVIFMVLVTPVSLILRMLKKDPLYRRLDKSASTYWIPKSTTPKDPGAYEKLF